MFKYTEAQVEQIKAITVEGRQEKTKQDTKTTSSSRKFKLQNKTGSTYEYTVLFLTPKGYFMHFV